MRNPENIIAALRTNPETFADSFANPLTFQEELLLARLEKDLGKKVHEILDLVLAGGPEIVLSQEDRANVIELSYFQKSILRLLNARAPRNGRTHLN